MGRMGDLCPRRSGLPSSREFEDALLRDGFLNKKSRSGSHLVYFKKIPGQLTRVVIVQMNRKEIPPGTLSAMLRQAGWTKDYFESLRLG
jgi:predicted RNA binding protein YcfA (HicA-like mRNA interferase family)